MSSLIATLQRRGVVCDVCPKTGKNAVVYRMCFRAEAV